MVLQELAKKTDAQIKFAESSLAKQPVSIVAKRISFDDAIKRILRSYSYLNSYKQGTSTILVIAASGKNIKPSPGGTVKATRRRY